MADEWRETTIGALCDDGVAELQTGPFGSQLHAREYVDSGVPVVPTAAIRRRRIDHDLLPRISPSKADQLSRHRLRCGDILFARRGAQATGQVAIVRAAEEGFISGTGVIRLRVRPGSTIVDADFLSHVLSDPTSVEWFKFHAIGATMPNLNEGIIRSFPLLLPPLQEQRAIAHMLGTLDDKIELNRRMSETLEAMVRALFESWFVRFDPVRAKMEGRDPGLPSDLAAPFPDRLVDSELGEIPEGWELGTLADVADLNPEVWTKDARPPTIRYVELSGTKWGRIDEIKEYSAFEAPSRAQRVLRPGDTIVGTVRPGNGSFALISQEGLTGSTGFAVLRPRAAEFTEFIYLAVTARDNIEWLAHVADGAAYPAVRPEVVAATPVALPPIGILQRFSSLARVLFARSAAAIAESRTLAALRDTLLPKLISGELRVQDAERLVAAAT